MQIQVPVQCFSNEIFEQVLKAKDLVPSDYGVLQKGEGLLTIWQTVSQDFWAAVISLINGTSCLMAFGNNWETVIASWPYVPI